VKVLEKLLETLRAKCAAMPDKRTGKNTQYSMLDMGMAAFSVFFMQNESFLQHQQMLEDANGSSNCKTLFGMSEIPTDPHIRKMLDGISPNHFDDIFAKTMRTMDDESSLMPFRRLGDHVLIALDGTEYFQSYDIHCANCSHRERKNGKTQYHHTFLGATMVAPGHKQAVPLPPEFIVPQDGHDKQDCESIAARRWLEKHGSAYAGYNPIYLGDDLFSRQPICDAVKTIGAHFIFTCKPDSHKTITEYLIGASFSTHSEKIMIPGGRGKHTTHNYRWVCDLPLHDGPEAMNVNWFEMEIVDADGKVTYHNSFVTNLLIHQGNIVELAACGRTRWKIENEMFNTLKNNGYNLTHNFGHGKHTLASVLVVLNLIAFAFHTACEITEELWTEARNKWKARRRFFGRLWNVASFLVFSTWDALMAAIIRSPFEGCAAPSG